MTTDDDLTRRAYAAYFRTGSDLLPQPAEGSGVQEHNGLRYVVLLNAYSTLAVYRVFTKGGEDTLRRLTRWPAEVADA